MKYYIYKITNLINGNFYIGRRQCECDIEKDDYFGSGQRLKAAIRKHGKESFVKEIIKACSSYEELVQSEKDIVTEELVNSEKCYNLALGGHGGYTFYENRVMVHTAESKAKISAANKGRKRPDVAKRLAEDDSFTRFWIGKKRSEIDKHRKSVAATERLKISSTEFNRSVQCPYCGKTGQQANMMRWHFEHCKTISRQTT